MKVDKRKEKVTHESEGVEVRVTHEADSAWHAQVKLEDDSRRRKVLNFVEDSADELVADIQRVARSLGQAEEAVWKLLSEQQEAEEAEEPQ